MTIRAETVPASIEHLDFAPMCEASLRGCKGTNPADYLAAIASPCCLEHKAFCSACVHAFVSIGRVTWRCQRHGTHGPYRWLDFVTLHPLGGTP